MKHYIELIQESDKLTPEQKLTALSEIDRLQNGEMTEAAFEDHPHLAFAFTWANTENGLEFWDDIYERIYP